MAAIVSAPDVEKPIVSPKPREPVPSGLVGVDQDLAGKASGHSDHVPDGRKRHCQYCCLGIGSRLDDRRLIGLRGIRAAGPEDDRMMGPLQRPSQRTAHVPTPDDRYAHFASVVAIFKIRHAMI